MEIVLDDLSDQEIADFLADHVRRMRAITPLESKFALDLDALRAPDVTFWTAREDGAVVGCAALRQLDPAHGELKSMRTRPDRTRRGVASLLLDRVLAVAAGRSYRRVSLETGTTEDFAPARRLYERYGFTYCDPFGDYSPSPHNTFMTKEL